VLHHLVGLVGGDDQGAAEDDEPLRRQLARRGPRIWGVVGEQLDGLGHAPAGGGGGDAEPGCTRASIRFVRRRTSVSRA
jgi:hypothetical protein